MREREKRKTLIEPKVRLLLWVYLHGIKDESNWRSKLARKIDYGTGNLDLQINDLMDKNLIESCAQNSVDPPYKITEDGKRFLQPIMFTSKIGMFMGVWVSIWSVVYFLIFFNQPLLMMIYWLPLLIASFMMLAVVLIFYPYLLMRLGKISYQR